MSRSCSAPGPNSPHWDIQLLRGAEALPEADELLSPDRIGAVNLYGRQLTEVPRSIKVPVDEGQHELEGGVRSTQVMVEADLRRQPNVLNYVKSFTGGPSNHDPVHRPTCISGLALIVNEEVPGGHVTL